MDNRTEDQTWICTAGTAELPRSFDRCQYSFFCFQRMLFTTSKDFVFFVTMGNIGITSMCFAILVSFFSLASYWYQRSMGKTILPKNRGPQKTIFGLESPGWGALVAGVNLFSIGKISIRHCMQRYPCIDVCKVLLPHAAHNSAYTNAYMVYENRVILPEYLTADFNLDQNAIGCTLFSNKSTRQVHTQTT